MGNLGKYEELESINIKETLVKRRAGENMRGRGGGGGGYRLER